MTAYTPVQVSRAGGDISTPVAPNSSGDTFPAGFNNFLRVKTTGTPTTVTLLNASANSGPSGTFLAQVTIAAAATQDKLYGPFPANAYADPSDGQVHVAYSSVTGVTVQVITTAVS